ncbi:MAG: diacylglycerol kinase [Rickettsiales bacterium]|nr:MAG: diacylglycerol kinase [Rickettsiales bacterium]
MKPKKHGIMRILNAFKYSVDGFIVTLKSEEAFRQDVLIFLLFFFVAIFLPVNYIEKILLFSGLFLIILMELTNTALEFIINRISTKIHPLSKFTKDIGSCLVLISFIYTILVWGIILWQNRFTIF